MSGEGGAGAVVLLNMGGPDSESAVEPFLANLFSDPAILPLPLPGPLRKIVARSIASRRSGKVIPRYRSIGGKSPQNEITRLQAAALEDLLNRGGGAWRVFFAMRYWHPRADEVLGRIAALGPSRLLAIPLYPHYTSAVTGSSFSELRTLAARRNVPFPIEYPSDFHLHPLYLEALRSRIIASLESFSGGGAETFVLFSAHNLPEKLVRRGDPYLDQVRETVEALRPSIGARPWQLAFQSRSGPVRWLEPEVTDALRAAAGAGHRQVLMVPVSFVSDQIETLYEIDRIYTDEAAALGITRFHRIPAFNDAPDFIRLLAAIVHDSSPKKDVDRDDKAGKGL